MGANAVYRFDRSWGNAELLFGLADATGAGGITYDPVNGTLWVILFSGGLVQYSLDGDVISSTSALDSFSLVGLSYDPGSDSFWAYNRSDTFYNFDRNGQVLRTVVVPGFSPNNAYGGEIALVLPTRLTVTPNPTTVVRGGTVQVAARAVADEGPAPVGTIAISSGSASCEIASSDGTCDLTLPGLGPQTIAATFTPANPFAFLGSTAEATVTGTCPAITIAPPSLPASRVGEPYAIGFTASGGLAPYAFAIDGALPEGLTLTGDTVSGTPAGEFSGSVTVRAIESGGACSGDQTYALTIGPPEPAVREYTLAEGVTNDFFASFILIANPNASEAPA